MRSGVWGQLAIIVPILLMAQPVWAENRLAEIGDQEQRADLSQVTNHLSLEQNEEPVTHSPQSALPTVIPRLNELEDAATTVDEWMTQLAQVAEVLQATEVAKIPSISMRKQPHTST
ncbi:hypothetical protein [Leptolyngbya sp. 7M]|uniref:hypothetical protein n=1 Tax=Leptolyngbya sp. 7M TaxID=2812896 RepID=UPI001B8CDA40|nr:hypothetical protein [Leptolyngbya sp. 7M]QYO62756.1 hypothetical protein JVX88_22360 [Leptolyngbya sp. 7M]